MRVVYAVVAYSVSIMGTLAYHAAMFRGFMGDCPQYSRR